MNRFDGTAARQLVLLQDDEDAPVVWRQTPPKTRPVLRMLRKAVYDELSKGRRKAQIAARHLLDKA